MKKDALFPGQYSNNEIVKRCQELNESFEFGLDVAIDSQGGTVSDDNFRFTITRSDCYFSPTVILENADVTNANYFLDGFEHLARTLYITKEEVWDKLCC
tara:strand:- start:517 stop:816 length:300 start_codon:yes stop_codon:yes gene_type:complete